MKSWLVVYDISNHRNRLKVARLLKTRAFHIQKSTFYIEKACEEEIQRLLQSLAKYLQEGDRLFAYPVEEPEVMEGYAYIPWEIYLL